MMEQECRELHFGGRCTRRDGHDGRHEVRSTDGLVHQWWTGLQGRTHWEDIRDGRVYASGTEQTKSQSDLCGDVFDGEEGKRTCDRPKYHAGPHSRGEGINAYEWPCVTEAKISLTEASQAARVGISLTEAAQVLHAVAARERASAAERIAEQIWNDNAPIAFGTVVRDKGIAYVHGVMRKWSRDHKPGFVADTLNGGFVETDEALRVRTEESLQDNMRTFTRLRSNTPKEGYVEDHMYAGYCESDETLRARIRKTIGISVTGTDPVDGASGFERDAVPYSTGGVDEPLNTYIHEDVEDVPWQTVSGHFLAHEALKRGLVRNFAETDESLRARIAAVEADKSAPPLPSNGQTPIGDTGASSSHAIDVRFEMIPREFLECLGARFHHGLKHGRFNYRKGLRDKQFVLDRIAHMYEHMGRLFQPMPDDEESFLDNIGAIGWGLCFLCEVYADNDGKFILESLMRTAPGKK